MRLFDLLNVLMAIGMVVILICVGHAVLNQMLSADYTGVEYIIAEKLLSSFASL